MDVSMPAIELEIIGNGQKCYWSNGQLFTEEEYLNGVEAHRMYTAKDPRFYVVVPRNSDASDGEEEDRINHERSMRNREDAWK